MSNNENIYDEWRRTLDGLGLQADERSQQKARVVAARAQVDQAISLATIADSLDQLVAHFTGRPADAPVATTAPAGPKSWGIQSEHDVEVGDLVVPVEVDNVNHGSGEVTEVGLDGGEAWIRIDDQPMKFWAKQFVVVEHNGEPGEPEPLGADVLTPQMAQAVHDDLDDDFIPGGTLDADEQQADALAALRARQGKGKKGGQKR